MICYYLHQLTYPEVLATMEDKNNRYVGTVQGQGVDDLAPKQLWLTWQKEVRAAQSGAYARFKEIPQRVHDYFQATKHLSAPPEGELVIPTIAPSVAKTIEAISQPVAFTPPRFSWSLTSLQDFENCPLCFAEKRYFKRFKDKPFDAQDWGNRLHKTAEDYAKDLQKGQTSQHDPELLTIVKPYCDAIVASAKGGDLYIEHDLALTKQFQPCSPTDWDVCWYRGKSDVTLVKGETIYVYDFKSGKKKDDPTQLNLMCACEAILHPQVQRFEGRYIWLRDKSVSQPVVLERKDLVGVWRDILARVNRMEQAWNSETFQARTSGLCKQYCPVTTCAHCGRR